MERILISGAMGVGGREGRWKERTLTGPWRALNDEVNGACLLPTGNLGHLDRADAGGRRKDEVVRRWLGLGGSQTTMTAAGRKREGPERVPEEGPRWRDDWGRRSAGVEGPCGTTPSSPGESQYTHEKRARAAPTSSIPTTAS